MLVWCGAVGLSGGLERVRHGVYYTYPNGLDNYGMYNGHGLCNPPAQSSYQPAWYNNPISLGEPLGVGGSPSSQIAGSVTPTYLKAANVDYLNVGSYNGPFGFDVNYMRFRHMNNNVCNFLF